MRPITRRSAGEGVRPEAYVAVRQNANHPQHPRRVIFREPILCKNLPAAGAGLDGKPIIICRHAYGEQYPRHLHPVSRQGHASLKFGPARTAR